MIRAILFSMSLLVSAAAGQQLPAPQQEIPLYPGVAPGSENWTWSERTIVSGNGRPVVQNVTRPVLQYYPAKDNAARTAMIVAPGGGYRNLMMSYEGVDIAHRLNQMGIQAFVVKYRLTYTDPDAPAGQVRSVRPSTGPQAGQNLRELGGADGLQAVRVLRRRAAEFGVAPDRIGMIGFSAGGGVTLSAVAGPPDGRPNFAAAIYADTSAHVSPPEGTPVPALFIAVAADDQSVGYQGSLDLFSAWRKANIPVELHIFQKGRHGFSQKGGGADHFMDRLEEWLQVNGWLTTASSH